MPQNIESIVAMYAVMKLGAAFAPLNALYPEDRLNYIFHDCDAKVVIDPGFFEDIEKYDPISESIVSKGEDSAVIVYTSGSTGNPKGVLINHQAILDCVVRNAETVEATEDDVMGLGAPFFFIAGVTLLFAGLAKGLTNVLIPMSAMRNPGKLAQVLSDEQVSISFIIPYETS